MQYTSTRGPEQVSGTRAILNGLAADGGLYMPLRFPSLDYRSLLPLSFTGMAGRIFSLFLDDFDDLPALAQAAYRDKFDTEEITPLKKVGDRYVLELFHGPTCAFKDVALSALPLFMRAAMIREKRPEEILILTATSGDTGKAAMEGFKDVEGIRILVFYPDGGVSPIQERQMRSQEGRNVGVAAIRGNFDDAQTAVKEIFTLAATDWLPSDAGVMLSSANSINIGRLIPQIVYYFKAYADLVKMGEITEGDPVDFAVPTGNFGDILAGFFAKKLGLPVGRLICASNANDVLCDFIASGLYDRNRPFYKTTSPSMDILVSSNLERLLYLLADEDAAYIRQLMNELKQEGRYQLRDDLLARLQADFSGGSAGDAEAAEVIRRIWEKEHYLLDPHTAVAWCVSEKCPPEHPCVVLSTASPFKFPEAVLGAIGALAPADPFLLMEHLSHLTGLPVPGGLADLKERPVRFSDLVEKDDLPDYVLRQIQARKEKV